MIFVWTLSDVLSVLGFILIVLIVSIYGLLTYIKRFRCPHENINENSACDAICKNCGKNLGFIGNYRKRRMAEGEE